jgi:hypothetical protein
MARVASLKCCNPKGIPIIVRHRRTPNIRWVIQSSQPRIMIQRILPRRPPTPKLPISTCRPNGHNTNSANLKHCRPNGMPIIVRQTISPANAHRMAPIIPPRSNHRILPIKFIYITRKFNIAVNLKLCLILLLLHCNFLLPELRHC